MFHVHRKLLAAAVLSLASAPTFANLVNNGGFENLSGTGFSDWTITGAGIAPDSNFPNMDSSDAAFFDFNGSSPLSVLSQDVNTTPGAQYALSFSLLDQSGLSTDTFNVTFGAFTAVVTGDQAAPPGAEPSFYTAFTLSIPGGDISAGLTALMFSGSIDPSSGTAWNLDDVSLVQTIGPTPAPEPGSLVLLSGLVALAWSRRRRG